MSHLINLLCRIATKNFGDFLAIKQKISKWPVQNESLKRMHTRMHAHTDACTHSCSSRSAVVAIVTKFQKNWPESDCFKPQPSTILPEGNYLLQNNPDEGAKNI